MSTGKAPFIADLLKDGCLLSVSTVTHLHRLRLAHTKETGLKKLVPCKVKIQLHESNGFHPVPTT
jgi:hypothetical protein